MLFKCWHIPYKLGERRQLHCVSKDGDAFPFGLFEFNLHAMLFSRFLLLYDNHETQLSLVSRKNPERETMEGLETCGGGEILGRYPVTYLPT